MKPVRLVGLGLMMILALNLGARQDYLREVPGLRIEIDLNLRTYFIDEPIPVKVTVINESQESVDFDLGRHLFQNYQFRVRGLKNNPVPERESFKLEKYASRQDLAPGRSVRIAPGERFGREIDIANWLRLVDPGIYEVTGFFLLRPERSPVDWRYTSNAKRFVLEPPRDVAVAVREQVKEREERDLKRLSAGETVDYVITAKRESDWDAYFRYLDLERLIQVFGQYRPRYLAAELTERPRVMNEFKDFLRNFPAEKIDHHFIQKESVVWDEETLNQTAAVECLIVYKTGLLVERKLYHFSLYRKLDRWFVSSYYVINR